MNYFNSRVSAERYTVGRPDFHANTVQHIREFLKLDNKLNKALDIACGTGLSTKVLLSIANDVYGTDLSAEMLNLASGQDQIKYTVAAAESQPFDAEEFDLITVSSGVHWFNIDAFLNEANRLLVTGGWLVIYENFFSGNMEGNDKFKIWVDNVYLRRFPAPPRNKNYDWSQENIGLKDFIIQIPDNFTNPVSFNRERLIKYFTTQSNIIAAVETGDYTYTEIERWLNKQLTEFFEDENAVHVFHYGNWIKYLQKI